jgi:hypothetical protein
MSTFYYPKTNLKQQWTSWFETDLSPTTAISLVNFGIITRPCGGRARCSLRSIIVYAWESAALCCRLAG